MSLFTGEPGSSNFVGGGSGIKGEKGDVGPVGPPGKTNTVYCKDVKDVSMISKAGFRRLIDACVHNAVN